MVWGILLMAATAGLIAGMRVWQRKTRAEQYREYRYIRILPHVDTTLDPGRVIGLIEQFAGYARSKKERWNKGREWFRFLIHSDGDGKIAFYFGYPQDRKLGIEKAFKAAYPECELHPVQPEDVPLPREKGGAGGFFILKDRERQGLPLKAFDGKYDALGDVLLYMEPGTWIDLVFSPESSYELKRTVRETKKSLVGEPGGRSSNLLLEALKEFDPRRAHGGGKNRTQTPPRPQMKMSDLDPDEAARLKGLRSRYSGRESAFLVKLAIWSTNPQAPGIVQTLATRIESAVRDANGLWLKRTPRPPIRHYAPDPPPNETMLWTSTELANIVHLPTGDHPSLKHVPHLERGQRSLGPRELTEGVVIGYLKHPLQQGRPVAIPYEQFTKHFVLTGMTGAGKSSTAIMMVQSLIDAWIKDPNRAPGFSYFDPAQNTVATILTRLLKAEKDGARIPWEKVHYAYLGETPYPLGLNLLHRERSESKYAVAKDVLFLLKYAYAGDTPRMDRIVENALLTLLEDEAQAHTILGLIPLLRDENWRDRVLPHVRDPIVKAFWEGEEVSESALEPILNRLSPLTTDVTMRRMFGQAKWSLDIRKYMDEGHIFLWDLLNVDHRNIKLAVGHIINQYHITAKNRMPGSKLHVLMIDEAHLVQPPVLAKIIAEDRKFGLSLGLITQYVGQFQDWLIEAISENVGTILTLTQGEKSAGAVSRMTAGSFDTKFLQRLPERVVAVYTKTKGPSGRDEVITLTVESDPPYMYKPDGEIANYRNPREIKQATDWALAKGRELQVRDGRPAREVDREIEQYLRGQTLLQIARQKGNVHSDGGRGTPGGEKTSEKQEHTPPKLNKKRASKASEYLGY